MIFKKATMNSEYKTKKISLNRESDKGKLYNNWNTGKKKQELEERYRGKLYLTHGSSLWKI